MNHCQVLDTIRSLTLGLRHQAEALERALALHQLDNLPHLRLAAVRLRAEADLALRAELAELSREEVSREISSAFDRSRA